MCRILVAYFSHSGNTRRVAQKIAGLACGDCLEIIPKEAYPLNYQASVQQAKKEIKARHQPHLKNRLPDLTQYDVICVGTPNWCSTVAPPVATFLSECSLRNKKIAPFCTHGGGGAGHIFQDIKKMCPQAATLAGLSVYAASNCEADVRRWVETIQRT